MPGQKDILEARKSELHDKISLIIDTATTEERGISDEEQVEIDGHHAEIRAADKKLDTLTANEALVQARAAQQALVPVVAPVVPIVPESPAVTELRTQPYHAAGKDSWFLDRYQAEKGDRGARERLEVNFKYRMAHDNAFALEQRAGATTVAGAGGEWAPPAWYENQMVALLRPGRVFADTLNKQVLPPNVSSINLPKVNTGVAVAAQATQNTQIAQQDVTTTSVNTGITTIAGGALVSLQLLQQSPVNPDQVLLQDLAKALAVQIDTAAISAVAGVSGLNAVTYTDASPTSLKVTQSVQQAIDAISNGVYETPTVIVMRPERWGKLIAASDAANRPFVLPSSQYGPSNNIGHANGQNAQGYAGNLRGVDVYLDPNIPNNLGGSTNQDEIFVLAANELYLYESQVFFGVFEQTYANTLSLYLRAHEFFGIIANRYPKAISVVSGTGMVNTLAYGS